MDREELRDRVRQEVNKRQDRLLSSLEFDFTSPLQGLSSLKQGGFFFSSDSIGPALDLLRERLPGQVEQIIQQAEKNCRHHFDLLGYQDLDFGDPIDWHLDPVHQKRAPQNVFYKVRYLDFGEVGDSKITWELNRHQHFVTLAKAYRLTGDERYAEEIFRQWREWLAANPYPIGINWASSLEVAFRSLSWIWTYYLLQDTQHAPRFRDHWLSALALHGRHIERYLSTYFSPNTHLLGEGVGLFFLGVLCPELPAAKRWKSLGWEIVLRESGRQVRADGFHFEQSTYYHVYALDLFLHSYVLARLNGIAVPKSFETTLEKMLAALYLLGRSGSPPHFGDDDGGRVFDPRRNRGEHMLDPLATGALLFHRGEYKLLADRLREETIWLLGADGVRQWDELHESPIIVESAALQESGFYLLATQKPPMQLVVDAGPQGTQSGGHGHADALSVCWTSEGHSLLIDAGTYEYVGNDNARNLFRGTGIHNTLLVDEKNQAEPATPFSWRRLTQTKVAQWIRSKNFDLLVASHDGYERLPSPVTHCRSVFSLKNGIYLVRDVATGKGKHQLESSWHLGPDVEQKANNLFRVKNSSLRFALLPAQGQDWAEQVCQEEWSPVYGRKEPMAALKYKTVTELPAEFALLLVALQEDHRNSGSFTRVAGNDSNSRVSVYEYATESNVWSFVFAPAGTRWQHNSISSDAEFVCWNRKIESSDHQLIQCNGSYTEVAGQFELRYRQAVPWCELLVQDGRKTVYSSNPDAVKVSNDSSKSPEPGLE
jgi:Heparinase II/III-like protein/Heparinase II/III N-terminus